MVAALPHLAARRDVLRVTHQTGKLDFEKVRAGYAAAGWTEARRRARVHRRHGRRPSRAADLIVSRAGATTSFELMAAGKAALMVPLPGQLEQRRNAEALQEAGAARMILQDGAFGRTARARDRRARRRPRARHTRWNRPRRKLARGDAAAAAVDLMEKLVVRQRQQCSSQFEVSAAQRKAYS